MYLDWRKDTSKAVFLCPTVQHGQTNHTSSINNGSVVTSRSDCFFLLFHFSFKRLNGFKLTALGQQLYKLVNSMTPTIHGVKVWPTVKLPQEWWHNCIMSIYVTLRTEKTGDLCQTGTFFLNRRGGLWHHSDRDTLTHVIPTTHVDTEWKNNLQITINGCDFTTLQSSQVCGWWMRLLTN